MPEKKILFVIDSLGIGGAEKSLTTLLSFLSHNSNYDITLLTVARGGAFEKHLPPGITPATLPLLNNSTAGRINHTLRRIAMFVSRKIMLGRVHNVDFHWKFMGGAIPPLTEKYDIAIAYQQGLPTFFVDKKVCADRKICWINANLRKSGYDMEHCRKHYRNFDTIVAVSDILRDMIVREYPELKDKITTINDIVDIELIHHLASGPSPYPTDSAALKLLTVGRLHHEKGQDIALQAAHLLTLRGLDFHWYFVGDGPMKEQLERLVSRLGLDGKVTLCGFDDNPYPYIKHCDIYIQPSRHEGYGISLFEAGSFHRPLVTTDFPVARVHINSDTGLIAPTSPEGLADAIIRLSAPETREKLYSSPSRSFYSTAARESLLRVTNLLNHA